MKNLMRVWCVLLAVLTTVTALRFSLVPVNALEASAPTVTAEETAAVEQTQPTETEAPAETAPAETVPPVTEPDVTEPAPVETVAVTEPPVETEPVPAPVEVVAYSGYAEVPLYFQTDYPNQLFGGGSIANNGCGVTCLAMVATYLSGNEYLPDELARYFGGVAENNIERLEKGADALQLPWEKMLNFHKAMDALREGKVVICLMNGDSIFTETQHFIVLTGFNENGLITVNDPYEPNYEKWDLKRAFQEGFTEGDICCGFSGAWAFDKSAMPEEPFRYYEEDLRGEPRYPDIQLTFEELQLLARMVWVEARGESAEGQQAVAEVVLNRLADGGFPDSLKSVIYAEGQFRSAEFLEDAEPEQAQYDAVEHAIYGPYVLPEDVVHFATYPVNEHVWGQIGGHIFCRQN